MIFMRILFVNSIQMFGGGEVWMLRTLSALQNRGHEVSLLCRPSTQLEREARAAGITVLTLKMRGDLDPVVIWKTARILRRNKIQIVLTNMDKELRFAGLAALFAPGCAVIPRRGIDYPLKNRLQYRLSYGYLADAVIANSQATKRALLRHSPWLAEGKVQVIYNGIDPCPFMAPPERDLRQEWGIPLTHRIIGFVGQLDERKGIDELLVAFAHVASSVNHVHLVLCGIGPLEDKIRQFAATNGLTDCVHLVGFHRQIPSVMQAIDCLVLPSHWEGFGIVLIEAMAAGKPCITTAISSMPEIVVDQTTGRIVPVGDSDALAEAMQQIVLDPELARRFGRCGRERVLELFQLDTMIDRLEELFANIWNHVNRKPFQE